MATISSLPLSSPLIAPLAPVSLQPSVAGVAAAPMVLPVSEPVAPSQAQPAAAALPANLSESAAMRPDQVFMARQMAWPVWDGASLASAWRTMVRAYGAQLTALQQQGRAQASHGSFLMTGWQGGTPGAQANPAVQQNALLWHPEAWRFVLPGPGGQQMALRLLAGHGDAPPSRRRRAKAALRLEVVLADGSHATVQLEMVDGVLMELAAEHPRAVAHLRHALPALQRAIEQAGLRLTRASVRLGLWPATPLQQYTPQVSAALPPSLFSAMADVALLLTGSTVSEPATSVAFSEAAGSYPPPGIQDHRVRTQTLTHAFKLPVQRQQAQDQAQD